MISRSTARWGLPCCPSSRCVRAVVTTPVEPLGACRSLPQRWQLSLYKRQVSFHIDRFEACSTFTRVAARTLAESPSDPFHRRLQPGRYLPDCSDCYRPERPLPEGTFTLSRTVPFHGTRLRFAPIRPTPCAFWFAICRHRCVIVWEPSCARSAHPTSN